MLTHFYWADVRHLSNLLFKSSSDLEADTEGEGERDDDHEPRDGGQEPAAHPYAGLRVVGGAAAHGGLLLPVDADGAHVGAPLPVLVTAVGVNLQDRTFQSLSLEKIFWENWIETKQW